jgi:hypothetical protein
MSVLQIDSTITPVAGSAHASAAASNASLPAVANKVNWIEGFDLSGCAATTGSTIAVTVTGLLAGTLTYEVAIQGTVTNPAFAGNSGIFSVRFPQPLPASAVNSAITVNVPSFGSGSTAQSCNVYGYYK